MATSRGIALDKAMTLRGRPTQITEHRNVAEILKALKAKGATVILPHPHGTFDATAEEVDNDDHHDDDDHDPLPPAA